MANLEISLAIHIMPQHAPHRSNTIKYRLFFFDLLLSLFLCVCECAFRAYVRMCINVWSNLLYYSRWHDSNIYDISKYILVSEKVPSVRHITSALYWMKKQGKGENGESKRLVRELVRLFESGVKRRVKEWIYSVTDVKWSNFSL